jgi:uncharacterized integral membrane protein (TIGR00698 family)
MKKNMENIATRTIAQGSFKKLNTFLNKHLTTRQILFIAALSICLTTWISPGAALLIGVVVAQLIGHPFIHLNHKATRILLQVSVVGLGFGMNVYSALAAGREGLIFAIASITGTLILGSLAGRLLRTDKKSSWLIACGTAICGGSAIAAISPVIKAEERQVSVAMGTIFLLNAVALFLFPAVGHLLHLTQQQFGLWSAIAIQDTSSVVGAAAKYGPESLQIATTVKLARALWIIPVALLTAYAVNRAAKKRDGQPGRQSEVRHNATNSTAIPPKKNRTRINIPWFIGLFILAMIANTYLSALQTVSSSIVHLSKTGLTITLFLIGAGLSKEAIRSTGIRPLLQGLILWVILSGTALLAVLKMG